MKVWRILSIVIFLIILILLALGNIYYKDIRNFAESNYLKAKIEDITKEDSPENKNLDYSIVSYTDKNVYKSYEKVIINVAVNKKSDNSVPENSKVVVRFYNNKTLLKDIMNNEEMVLKYNKEKKCWEGIWYPDNVNLVGRIEGIVKAYLDIPLPELESKIVFNYYPHNFNFSIPNNLAFLSIDSTERITKRSILSIDGKETDWNSIVDWIKYLSSDGLIMLGGITKTFNENASLNNPWDNEKLNEIDLIELKAKDKNFKFGVWIKSLKVEGIYTKKIGYIPTLNIRNNTFKEVADFISLNDQNRKQHIQKLYNDLLQKNNINFIGFSDLFLDIDAGYEMIDDFFSELNIQVPKNWNELDSKNKANFVKNTIENDNKMFKVFIKWKNYKVSEYIKSIITETNIRKPIFYFLDYKKLAENPDIPYCLFNSGIDFIILDFNISYKELNTVLSNLRNNKAVSENYDRFIISYYFDYKNLDVDNYQISALENYNNIYLKLINEGSDIKVASGILINDFYKAMFGRRGPYSPYEWFYTIGSVIHQFKYSRKKYPFIMDVGINRYNFSDVYFSIINTSTSPLYNISIIPLENLGIKLVNISNLTISQLQPGEEKVLNFKIDYNLNNEQFLRKRRLIGFNINYSETNDKGPKNSTIYTTAISHTTSVALSTNMITNEITITQEIKPITVKTNIVNIYSLSNTIQGKTLISREITLTNEIILDGF